MTEFIETYTWQQAAIIGKFDKLQVELEMIAFAIYGNMNDIYILSKEAALEGMKYFDKRLEDHWQSRKEYFLENYPKFNFDKRLRYTIDGEPIGEQISLAKFVGFDYKNEEINVQDYRGKELAHSLLAPPYGLNLKINYQRGTPEYQNIKTKEFTGIYRMLLDDFILLSEYKEEDLVIYRWSDDWSNFFDAGKEWWGSYYWTVFNKKNNTIIVLGASESD